MASVSVSGAGVYVSAPVLGDQSLESPQPLPVPGYLLGNLDETDPSASTLTIGANGSETVIGGGGLPVPPGGGGLPGGAPGLTVDPENGVVVAGLPDGLAAVIVSPTGDHGAVVVQNGGNYGMVYVNTGADGSMPGAAVGVGQDGDNSVIGTGGLVGNPVVVDTDNGIVFADLPVGQGAVHAAPDRIAVVADNGTGYGMVAVSTGAGEDSPGAAVGASGADQSTIIGTGGLVGTPVTADPDNGFVLVDLPVAQGAAILSPDGDRGAVVLNAGGQYAMVAVANEESTPGAAVVFGDTIISTANPGAAAPSGGEAPSFPPDFSLPTGADTVQALGSVADLGNATLLGAGALTSADPFASAIGGGLVNLGNDSLASSAIAGSFVQDQALHQLVAPTVETNSAAPATGSVLSLDDGLTTITLQGFGNKHS